MDEDSQDTKVEVPAAEATKLASELRKKLPNVPLSVYAAINANGVRILNLQCDHPENSTVWYNKNYRADADMTRLVAHAVKHVKAEFDLS